MAWSALEFKGLLFAQPLYKVFCCQKLEDILWTKTSDTVFSWLEHSLGYSL